MKIISNNECYIDGKDIEYIISYVPMIDEEVKLKLSCLLTKNDEYVKVLDNELIEFIKNCEFLISFDYLFMLDYSVLERMALKLKIELLDIEHTEDCISSLGDIIEYRDKVKNRRKNKEYLLKQITSMMNYKTGKSMCNFPNIPNPCISSVASEDMIASLSLDYENVLIYRIDNNKINNVSNSLDFGLTAYRLFMHDRFGSDTDKVCVSHRVSDDMKYISFSGINLENVENNNNERKL